MQMVILAVGKLKENYWREAQAEYTRRLSRYAQIDIVEVDDEPTPENASEAQTQRIVSIEVDKLSRHLRDRDGIIAMDVRGKTYSSEAWSEKYTSLQGEAFGRLVFVVGGSLGLNSDILSRAVVRWSFGPLTLPHQLARVVLLEQLYRGIRIARGEPYHK